MYLFRKKKNLVTRIRLLLNVKLTSIHLIFIIGLFLLISPFILEGEDGFAYLFFYPFWVLFVSLFFLIPILIKARPITSSILTIKIISGIIFFLLIILLIMGLMFISTPFHLF